MCLLAVTIHDCQLTCMCSFMYLNRHTNIQIYMDTHRQTYTQTHVCIRTYIHVRRRQYIEYHTQLLSVTIYKVFEAESVACDHSVGDEVDVEPARGRRDIWWKEALTTVVTNQLTIDVSSIA